MKPFKPDGFIRHPLLESIGVAHGFGTRDSVAPVGTLRPIQVHGADVIQVDTESRFVESEADVIVCSRPATSVAVVTADCIPILACGESGGGVAAIHAGWRGLAKGVVEAGIEALRGNAATGERIYAVIGPHIGRCCYEVDEPVLDAMAARFGADVVSRASSATRPGHARLSLAALAEASLHRAGVGAGCYERLADSCTACETDRFHSFRRQGEGAGRMLHFIVTSG
ncbi:MAG: polyphenol oxidase family protein [Myxococcales bacterium]|nr:polyphenol oxidase family protein [Myxococcales bacterium]